jgi:hypothetical protein
MKVTITHTEEKSHESINVELTGLELDLLRGALTVVSDAQSLAGALPDEDVEKLRLKLNRIIHEWFSSNS